MFLESYLKLTQSFGLALQANAASPLNPDTAYDTVGKPMSDFAKGAGYDTGNTAGGHFLLADTISLLISAFLSLLAIIFIIIIIVAGYGWMTAGGDSAKVDKAKDRIRNSVIGIVIIGLAYTITWFVFNIIVPWGDGGALGGAGGGG